MNFYYSYTTGPGKFSMHVADETGKIIWQSIHPAFITDTLTGALIPDDTPMELGMLKNLNDISGLERHLKHSRLIEPVDSLLFLKDKKENVLVVIESLPEVLAKGGILTYEPNPHLTAKQKEIETKFGKQLSENYQAEKERYLKKFGHVINTDNARELSSDYLKNKEELSSAVHEPASAFVKMLYVDLLEEKPESNYVLFTAGGTGAGKTTTINGDPTAKYLAENADIVYDSNMNNFPSAKKKIDQALESGRNAHILFIYRDPIEAFIHGVIPRAISKRRTVPIYEHVNTHIGSLKTVSELQSEYKDNQRVTFIIFDNSFKGLRAQRTTIAQIEKKSYLSKDELKHKLHVINENKKKSGEIKESIYKGFKGGETTFETGGSADDTAGTIGLYSKGGTTKPARSKVSRTQQLKNGKFKKEKGNQTYEQRGIPGTSYEGKGKDNRKRLQASPEHSGSSRKKQLAKGKLTPAKKEKLIKEVAKQYEGKKVEPKYQEKYGKRYSEKDAKSVAYAIANTVEKIKKQKGSPTKKKGYGSLLSGY